MRLGRRMEGMCFGMSLALGILCGMPARAAGPAPVDLGEAGGFVILAQDFITDVDGTAIGGDVGLSPNGEDSISGFPLSLDPSGTYSTSPQIDGRVFAADYASPTPTNLTAAVGDMTSAYINARDRTLPDFTGLYGGVLAGQTLAPGLYKWETDVSIFASGVTLSGGPTDVWIFQIAQDLTVVTGGIVTLAGGPSPGNIFWQVTGETTLGLNAGMKGIVLGANQIVMNMGASLVGRALTQTSVFLDTSALSMAASENAIFIDGFETGGTARW